MDFCEILVNARKEKGMSQKKLAEILEITPARLSNWEKGKREPDVFMIKKISRTLNISCNVLIGLPEDFGKKQKNEPNTLTTEEYSVVSVSENKEETILDKYNMLDDIDKGKIEERIDMLLEDDKYSKKELKQA